MDNWSRGWRKLVKWDNVNKVYIYKGNKIYPLSYKEQIEMPVHLQNSYYWGEIQHINRIIEAKEERERNPKTDGQEDLENALNMFFDSFETI